MLYRKLIIGAALKYIEILKTIKLTENISNSFWIHETHSAINHEFKMWIKGRYAWKADGLTGFIRHPILSPTSPFVFKFGKNR